MTLFTYIKMFPCIELKFISNLSSTVKSLMTCTTSPRNHGPSVSCNKITVTGFLDGAQSNKFFFRVFCIVWGTTNSHVKTYYKRKSVPSYGITGSGTFILTFLFVYNQDCKERKTQKLLVCECMPWTIVAYTTKLLYMVALHGMTNLARIFFALLRNRQQWKYTLYPTSHMPQW
jgi:hypothetical protein